uniref:ABC transporter domain-containing protein n=1 Tax=Timema tahoe TaxID=61484 RepID=A0A7R9I9H8_9NEOP|nr:unnamed protein product [Timema tahoe]
MEVERGSKTVIESVLANGTAGSIKGGLTSLRIVSEEPDDVHISDVTLPSTSSSSSALSTKVPKSRMVDITFTNLSYCVKKGIRRESKTILQNLSGEFLGGELTAIMGPSGAGKSSLMNIMAGYTRTGMTGSVLVNGKQRDVRQFRRRSCYIMQDDKLQPLLTVQEAMNIAAELKLSRKELSSKGRAARITVILDALGLSESRRTMTGSLSGGQRKRLAIALELLNNPPVMFFDEPTSGLDSSSCLQCLSLLKLLAREGRTIICTIHQPSATLLEMFDLLYVVSDGVCIYRGILEVATGDYGCHNEDLKAAIANGQCNDWVQAPRQDILPVDIHNGRADEDHCPGWIKKLSQMNLTGDTSQDSQHCTIPLVCLASATSDWTGFHSLLCGQFFRGDCDWRPECAASVSTLRVRSHCFESIPYTPIWVSPLPLDLPTPTSTCSKNSQEQREDFGEYPVSFPIQFYVLLKRAFLLITRDKTLSKMRLVMHMLIGVLIGVLYYQIGNEANHVIDNFGFLMSCIMFLMFTAFSSMVLTYDILKEQFKTICSVGYCMVVYFLTAQPLDIYRLFLFILSCSMVAVVAQSIGLIIGVSFSIQNGMVFGPLFIMPFTIFSGFFIHMNDASIYFRWLFHLSYLKYGLECMVWAVYGYERTGLVCNEIYCHYRSPIQFLKEIDMHNNSYWFNIFILVVMFFLLRLISFLILLFRLGLKR